MTKRYRFTDIRDGFESPIIVDDYSSSVDKHINTYGGTSANLNYYQKHYDDRGQGEQQLGLSTKYTVEGELASFRVRPTYHAQSMGVWRLPNATTSYDGWWHQATWPYSTGAQAVSLPEGSSLWAPDTVDRNVIWVFPPEDGGYTVDARDAHFLSDYGREMFSRGTYTASRDETPVGNKEQPPIYPRMRDGTYIGPNHEKDPTRSHPYHEYGFLAGGTWNQIIMDEQFDMLNSIDNGLFKHGWWINHYPYGEAFGDYTHSYFDCLTWVYLFINNSVNAWQSTPFRGYDTNSFYVGPEEYYVEDHAADKECDWWIHNMNGAYHPNRGTTGYGEFYVGFSAMHQGPYDCEVVYAFEDMHAWNDANPGQNAFDVIGQRPATHCTDKNGNPLLPGTGYDGSNDDGPGTSVMPWAYWSGANSLGDKYHLTWWTQDINPADVPVSTEFPDRKCVYFAVRPREKTWDPDHFAYGKNVGDPTYENKCGPWANWFSASGQRLFRQICITINSDVTAPCLLPPHLKRTPE